MRAVRLLPPESQTWRCRDSRCALPQTPSQVSKPRTQGSICLVLKLQAAQGEGTWFLEASSLLQIIDRHGSASKGRPCADLKQNQFVSESPTLCHSLAHTPWLVLGAGAAERKAEGAGPQERCRWAKLRALRSAHKGPGAAWCSLGLPGSQQSSAPCYGSQVLGNLHSQVSVVRGVANHSHSHTHTR